MRGNESRPVFSCALLGLVALVLPTPADGQQRRTFHWGVAFSCDTANLATCGDRVRIYEVKSGKMLREMDTGRNTHSVAFSPAAADLFAAGGDDGVLRLWRVGKKDFVREFRGHNGMIVSIAFEKSGRYVATASVLYEKGKRALGQFRLWEIKTGKVFQSLNVMASGIHGASFSGDGKLVAFGYILRDQRCGVDVYRLQPWKPATSIKLKAPEKLETTRWGQAFPFAMATYFGPDAKHLLIAGGICVRVNPFPYKYACRPTGLLWRADLTKPASAKLLVEPGRGYYRGLGLTPDGKRFATGSGGRVKGERPLVQMRDASNGKLLWSTVNNVAPSGVALSADGKLVAACQGAGVQLLDAQTGGLVRLIEASK